MTDFTTVLVVDRKHLDELAVVIPTWRRFRPEIFTQPMIVAYDWRQVEVQEVADVAWAERSTIQLVEWPPREYSHTFASLSQRERMLSAFVHVPPRHVKTKWWLKIDTDAVAIKASDWLNPIYFPSGAPFVSKPWKYTKPATQTRDFDAWADSIHGLKHYPRLNIEFEDGARTARHRRVISWVFFCRTVWSEWAASWCDYPRIPIPSQDGYHSMLAARTGSEWGTYPAKTLGWRTSARLSKLKEMADAALA